MVGCLKIVFAKTPTRYCTQIGFRHFEGVIAYMMEPKDSVKGLTAIFLTDLLYVVGEKRDQSILFPDISLSRQLGPSGFWTNYQP